MNWIAYQNADRTQAGCTTEEQWHAQPSVHQRDVDGEPMQVVERFRADTYNQAMIHFHELMGYEPYVPMDDDP